MNTIAWQNESIDVIEKMNMNTNVLSLYADGGCVKAGGCIRTQSTRYVRTSYFLSVSATRDSALTDKVLNFKTFPPLNNCPFRIVTATLVGSQKAISQ